MDPAGGGPGRAGKVVGGVSGSLYSVGMEVEDLNTTVSELKAKGAKITMEPVPITVGFLAFCEDPNGVRIALIQHA